MPKGPVSTDKNPERAAKSHFTPLYVFVAIKPLIYKMYLLKINIYIWITTVIYIYINLNFFFLLLTVAQVIFKIKYTLSIKILLLQI